LVTFHPVTLEGDTSRSQFKNLLDALDRLEETKLIFTKANADTYGRVINRMIDTYVKKNIRKAVAFTSMGQIKYLSTMRFVDAVVGNSSSGIIEAPSLNVPTINIGDRQKGRLRAKSIIDSVPASKAILNSIRVLYSGRFQRLLKTVVNPYGDGNTAKRIKRILKYCKITNIIKKHFYDINFITRSRYG
jgi:GDP/UDP-N,N'-diacetylbacillosamine 2-epimerase (hydrolysing)